MRKLATLMCVCAAAVMGVCSCSDSEDEKVIDKKVALILPSGKSIARWTDDAKYLSEALGKNGYEAKLFTAEETLEGAAEQVKQIEEAIKAGQYQRKYILRRYTKLKTAA